MYKLMPPISNESLIRLENLSNSVVFQHRIEHVGVNGYKNLSEYTNSKWYEWHRTQKQDFKNSFDSRIVDKSLIGWFIRYPKITGFLDRTEYWKNTNSAGIIVAYALNDGQDIHLDDERISVPKGTGIAFSLRVPHEVKAKETDQLWACLMTLFEPL